MIRTAGYRLSAIGFRNGSCPESRMPKAESPCCSCGSNLRPRGRRLQAAGGGAAGISQRVLARSLTRPTAWPRPAGRGRGAGAALVRARRPRDRRPRAGSALRRRAGRVAGSPPRRVGLPARQTFEPDETAPAGECAPLGGSSRACAPAGRRVARLPRQGRRGQAAVKPGEAVRVTGFFLKRWIALDGSGNRYVMIPLLASGLPWRSPARSPRNSRRSRPPKASCPSPSWRSRRSGAGRWWSWARAMR